MRRGYIVAIWVTSLSLFPEFVPTGTEVYKEIKNNIPELVYQTDYSFPYTLEDAQKPWILMKDVSPSGNSLNTASYFLSGSGISPQALNNFS